MTGNNEVELKGGMYTFMSLRLHTSDLDVIDKRIAEKVQQAPTFFKDTPVVVDLSVLEEQMQEPGDLDCNALLECIRKHKLLPIVASVTDKSASFAAAIALPLVEIGSRRQSSANKQKGAGAADNNSADASERKVGGAVTGTDITDVEIELTESAKAIDVEVRTPKLVNRPVRSGQQVYAAGTDLIVMGQVGPGAEVIADCNIHVYGPLRGKALCGVSGNADTRIFCQSLEAELVSVAGNFRVLEEIPEGLRGKPAQIWLDKDRLNIEPL